MFSLQLLHGRSTPNEQLNNWGFESQSINRLERWYLCRLFTVFPNLRRFSEMHSPTR